MLMPLSPVQKKVIYALDSYIKANGHPPTTPELANAIGRRNVSGEIKALEQKGWITRLRDFSQRSMMISDEAKVKLEQNQEQQKLDI